MYTGLFLQDQNIGFLSWQHKISSVASEANGTVNSMDVNNSISASQTVDIGRSTGVQQKSGIYIDPRDPNFKIAYTFSDQGKLIATDLFSALLEGMAIKAPNEVRTTGAAVNAISESGDLAINIHCTHNPGSFFWGLILQTFYALWTIVIKDGSFKDLDFEVSFHGLKIAEGFVLSMPTARACLVSSQQDR